MQEEDAKTEKRKLVTKIVAESFFVLIFASVLSSIGGIGIEAVQRKIIFFLPLLIVIPALNDMIGDFGTIVASNFTTLLYLGKIHAKNWWREAEIKRLLIRITLTSLLTAVYLGGLAYALAMLRGFRFDPLLFFKVLLTTMTITVTLVLAVCIISIIGGFYVHKHNHDPDNYLIPLATGVADLLSMVVLALMVTWLF